MILCIRLLQMLGIAAAAAIPTIACAAAAQRTFVASNGIDTNACTLASPCRSFAGALAKTNTGGEVIVLDSAGYGPVTIAQSVSIIAPPGIYAGISVFSGNGVTIATPGITVTLRGLSINGQGGDNGILYLPGAAPPTVLHVEDCAISGMASSGIVAALGALFVSDTVVRDNAGSGIFVGSQASATLARVRSEHNGTTTLPYQFGIEIAGGAHASISDSVFADNGGAGIYLANSATVSVVRSQVKGQPAPAYPVPSYGIRAYAPIAGQAIDLGIDATTIATNTAQALIVDANAGTVTFRVAGSTITSIASNPVAIGSTIPGGSAEGTIIASAIYGAYSVNAAVSGTRLHISGTAIATTNATDEAVRAVNGATIDLSDCTITGPVGLGTFNGGTIRTRGNNTITGSISGNVIGIAGH